MGYLKPKLVKYMKGQIDALRAAKNLANGIIFSSASFISRTHNYQSSFLSISMESTLFRDSFFDCSLDTLIASIESGVVKFVQESFLIYSSISMFFGLIGKKLT